MWEEGRVVWVTAGHDKDRFYAIVSVAEGRVAVADGKLRKLGKPKWKNLLHVRPTGTVLESSAVTTDKKLREALRPFNAGGTATNGSGGSPRKEGGYELCQRQT